MQWRRCSVGIAPKSNPSPASTSGRRHHVQPVEKVQALIDAFEDAEGRRPRILVAKIRPGRPRPRPEGDRIRLRRCRLRRRHRTVFATAEEAARQAVENDVHILGLSSLAAAHLTAVPELKAALKKQGRDDIMIIIGGVVPPQDYDAPPQSRRRGDFPAGHRDCRCRRRTDPQAQCAAWGTAKRRSSLVRNHRAI